MHRGAWWATTHGVAKSRTQLSDLCVCVTLIIKPDKDTTKKEVKLVKKKKSCFHTGKEE